MSSADILLVDDERVMRFKYRRLLENDGHRVREARNGEEALAMFYERRPSLVVLDTMMPVMGGIPACDEMRKADARVPIIFLSAVPAETTKLRAYGAGADDYVEKSDNDDILLAKVRAALRRSSASADSARIVRLGRVTVDLGLLRVTDESGANEELTKTEAVIFSELSAHRGEYLSNDRLFSALHGEDFVGDPSKIRNHVSTLRKKLGSARDMVVNNPNAGYRLVE